MGLVEECSNVQCAHPRKHLECLYIPFLLLLCFGFETPVFCAVAIEPLDGFFAWFAPAGRGFVAFFTTDADAGWMTGDFCRNTLGEGNCMTSIRCGDEEASRQLLALFPRGLKYRVDVGMRRNVVALEVGWWCYLSPTPICDGDRPCGRLVLPSRAVGLPMGCSQSRGCGGEGPTSDA